jgi:D-3-phosphoglycerate dehydrogenase
MQDVSDAARTGDLTDRPRVVVLRPFGAAASDEVVALLQRAGCEVEVAHPASEDEAIAAARDADGLIYTGPTSRRFIESLTRCRVIARTSIGMDAVDGVDLATEKGIVLCNMPGVIEEEVADQTLALLLACARWIVPYDRWVREGGWKERRQHPGVTTTPRLRGSTLGLVGFGRIARAVALRSAGFGMRLLAYDPYLAPEAVRALGATPATLGEVLQDSDFVSLHVPLTDETHHLIGAPELLLMKPHAILVNTCRGPVVDEAALIEALRRGDILAAGLDVMEEEPIGADNPLCALPNVVLAPHVASRSEVTDRERHIRPAQEVVAVLAGHRPRAVWNPDVLAKLGLS